MESNDGAASEARLEVSLLTAATIRSDDERFRLRCTRISDHGMWTCEVFQGQPGDEVHVEHWGAPDVANAASRFERFAKTATTRRFARPIES